MKLRILIIEDEPAIADNLVYALETEGFACTWCATGGEGLQAVERGFDLAVLDVGLPDMGGFDLCRAIRQKHDLPILFLTARSGEIDRVVGLELGADDYVVKPFSPREVAARIKAILRRTASAGRKQEGAADGVTGSTPGGSTDAGKAPATGPAEDPGAHLPFRHDAERKRIAYHGVNLDLSRYEYRLLLVFLEKPGRVWSREQLMERAWDSPESSLERTVDAHVKSLRAKLREAKPGVDAILTHRGMGYSLREDW
jgi:two-component system catabolic regulation response regulator CreB